MTVTAEPQLTTDPGPALTAVPDLTDRSAPAPRPTGGSPAPRPAGPRRRRALVALALVGACGLTGRAVAVQHDRDAARSEALVASSDRLAAAVARQDAQGRLDALVAHIDRTRTATAEATAAVVQSRETRTKLVEAVSALETELGGLEAERREGEQRVAVQAEQSEALRACLGALDVVQRQLVGNRPDAAVDALRAGAEPCRRAEAVLEGTTATSDFTYDFPDPFVLVQGPRSYAFATNGPAGAVQVLSAAGLTGWSLVGDALAGVPIWAQPGLTWAPSVLPVGSTYVMYYTVRDRQSGHQCISVAVASQPQGPYADGSWGPLICQHDLGGSIDPSPVRGPDGAPYLLWKSERDPGQGNVAHLWGQRLTADGLALEGAPVRLLSADQPWERGVVEGPSMTPVGPRWLLMYSGNRWDTADYASGFAWCAGPLGPCAKPRDPVALRSGADLAGPGGTEVFRDGAGTLKVVFHSWAPGAVGFGNARRFFVGTATVGPDNRVTISR